MDEWGGVWGVLERYKGARGLPSSVLRRARRRHDRPTPSIQCDRNAKRPSAGVRTPSIEGLDGSLFWLLSLSVL
eukprot:scaffold293637_cov40-Tisochrysis_lutea.AAC.1